MRSYVGQNPVHCALKQVHKIKQVVKVIWQKRRMAAAHGRFICIR